MKRVTARGLMEVAFGEVEDGPAGISAAGMRLEPGGGIAGNSDVWWLRSPGNPGFCRGPIRSKADFARVMRDLVSDALKMSDGLAAMERVAELDTEGDKS